MVKIIFKRLRIEVNNLSLVVQWSGHRTLNPRTRVRFPVEELFIIHSQISYLLLVWVVQRKRPQLPLPELVYHPITHRVVVVYLVLVPHLVKVILKVYRLLNP